VLSFEKLSLDEIDIIRPYFSRSLSRTCDNTVGAIFMWRDIFSTEFSIYNDTLIIKFTLIDDRVAFLLPLGHDINESLNELELYCKSQHIQLTFFMVAEEEIDVIKGKYSSLQIIPHEDWNDYLYRAEDLAAMTGRRYSGQRNHINYFIRTYRDYTFEEISDNNLNEVKDMYQAITSNMTKVSKLFEEDRKSTIELLDNYNKYGLFGGLLRAEGKVVAFAVGEIQKDTLFVHVERANNDYRGSYQMIVNLFSKSFTADGILYINRGEDLGDEGLRTAKKSLHPTQLIYKYTVIVDA